MSMFGKKARMPSREESLPGRADKMAVPERHCVNGSPLKAPFPAGLQLAQFGLGCFWGAGAQVLANTRRLLDRGQLWGCAHLESQL